MLAVGRDVVLVAEGRDGNVDRRLGAVLLRLGLGKLDRPTRVAILVSEFDRPFLPSRRDAPGLDLLLLTLSVALTGVPPPGWKRCYGLRRCDGGASPKPPLRFTSPPSPTTSNAPDRSS